jgi:DNA (cytosine-5)-methyltransferase 1
MINKKIERLKMKKLNVVSLFSGIGAFERGMEKEKIPYEILGFSEINKWSIKSYCALYSTKKSLNLGDISKVYTKRIKQEVDIITHGSPCQSFSTSGKRKGGKKGSGTQSSLMWHTVDIVEQLRPKCVVWENVKSVTYKNHIKNFELYLENLNELGYNNFYKVLNAEDFDIPQHRERMFVVSIKKELCEEFEFPKPLKRKRQLKDFIEIDFEEKIDENIINSCQKPFEENYERMLKSNKKIYQCKAKKGYQDKKVGLKVSPTIRAHKNHTCVMIDGQIKRINSKEMLLLMGFEEKDYDIIKKHGVSDAQIAKQSGNSIVVNVVAELMKSIYKIIG